MSNRLARMVLSLVVGSIGVAIGLYFGRFIAGGVGLLFASSRQAIPIATSTAWWAFIGLIGGLALAFSAVRKHRVLLVLASIVGFALGGAIAALPEASRIDRSALLATLAVWLGGALAGLLLGLGARLGVRALVLAAAGALAMFLARSHLEALIPPSDVFALLAPGALLGVVLAALAPERAAAPPA
ncbi:MAG TPA: hypothetical protein VJG32_04800 [Anaerolineae bacterium]|nr:hypothetical protein [Anaerolineae bacterium]